MPSVGEFDFDFIIVGSGFGGSVSAMRLAEKGYTVAVIERGRRFRAQDFARTNWDLRKYLWAPLFKCFGIQNISLFRNVLILSGTGVGGGSLVYANTLPQPGDEFFKAPVWKDLADWKAELLPHYATARKMLGSASNPKLTHADLLFKEVAVEMGRGDFWRPTEVAVYFGEPGKEVADPYFGGKGPARTGCNFCGGCMVGCRHDAKNTLDKNYLWFAEKSGARIIPETLVTHLRPRSEEGSAGYEVHLRSATSWLRRDVRILRARKVVLSGGVLGTVKLLLHCKFVAKTLPKISERLGHDVRTNSESLLGVSSRKYQPTRDFSEGIAITSIFHPDPHTHIEPVRYPKGSDFMRFLAAPMADGADRVLRPLRMIVSLLTHPLDAWKIWFAPRWSERGIILLVMQALDNKMRFKLGRNFFTFFRKSMTTAPEGEVSIRVPSYIPIGHEVARRLAGKMDGITQNVVNEVMLNIPITAHILGGCGIGSDEKTGVIDLNHEVFGYPGLYICDGSAVPANLGVNPSLTITAMSERAMSRIPTAPKRGT